tara:strand:- start:8785 stop:9021 length:237 start_codon:yes stop_codon:yes gene_type:complete
MRKSVEGKVEKHGMHLAVGLIGLVSFAHFILDGSVTDVMVHDKHLEVLENIESKLDGHIFKLHTCDELMGVELGGSNG